MFDEVISKENIMKSAEYLLNGKDTCGPDGMYVHELMPYLEDREDSCLIYDIGNTKYCRKERIGLSIADIDD